MKPKMIIGMPIYNEENFLENSIKSLLKQTYPNFQIIISDDVSKDKTPEICEKFASKDKRVKYIKNEVNMGSISNFNKLSAMADSKYFMWAAGHDRWDPHYVEKCIAEMEKDDNIVVCHAYTTMIDQNGEKLKEYPEGLNSISEKPYERIRNTIEELSRVNPNAIYGVIRLDALKKIRPTQDTYGSDHINLIELSAIGKIVQIKEYLYFQTKNRENEKTKIKDAYKRWSSPKRKKVLRLTYTKMFYSYLKALKFVKLSNWEKTKLRTYIIKIFLTRYLRKMIMNDFLRIVIGEENLYKLKNKKTKKKEDLEYNFY